MSKFVLVNLCAVIVLVSPHPLLQVYPQQCQCPANNYPQTQLLNIPLDVQNQHLVSSPQIPACNVHKQPHQCIPVTDPENKQFLGKVLENTLIKALQKQGGQQYQHSNPINQPHVVNNYFIIPTEALLGEEGGKNKKDKAKSVKVENGSNQSANNKMNTDVLQDEARSFLEEYLHEEPSKMSTNDQKQTADPSICKEDEKPIEVELEPTFAKIKEYRNTKVPNVPTQIEIEEALVQDVRNKFPNMPELLVRNLISVMNPRLQRTNPYQNQRHPHHQRPLANDYGNSTLEGRGNSWHQRPRYRNAMRRNPHRRRKGSEKNTTATSLAEDANNKFEKLELPKATQVEPPVTEIYRKSESSTESPKKFQREDDIKLNLIENTTPHLVYASHHAVQLPELGFEDIVPNVDNRINDDYYPNFVNDNKAHPESDVFHYPEFYDEVLKSERKHNNPRETQRSKFSDGKKAPKKVMRKLSERQRKDKEFNDNKEDENSEEIVFRIPPGLENPDFKTINVREYNNNHKKGSTYFSHEVQTNDNNEKSLESGAKAGNDEPVITYYLPSKSMEVRKHKPAEKLETVFANSKIVNYGQIFDGFDAETTTVANVFTADYGNN